MITQNTRATDRFMYHLEDLRRSACMYYKGKSKHNKYGCGTKPAALRTFGAKLLKTEKSRERRGGSNARSEPRTDRPCQAG